MRETPEWGYHTPENLRPAVKALAKGFETAVWRCCEVTEHFAYAGLHLSLPAKKDLTDYHQPLSALKQLVGRKATQEFDSMLPKGTEPAIFRAYLNLFRRGVEYAVTQQFTELLKIARANEAALGEGPVEWGKFQATHMVAAERHKVEMWVISVCDGRDLGPFPTDRDKFRDYSRRSDWRAPKFIHMEPSGNTPYNPREAWNREDEAPTESLRKALVNDFVTFVEIHLDKLAGEAEIKLAQETPTRPTRPVPLVSSAPPPPVTVRGGYHFPSPSNKPLLNYPLRFPKEVIPRANLVIHDGIQRFASQDQILDLCRYVIGELTPDVLKPFHIGKVEPHHVLDQLSELSRYLLIANCSDDNRRYALQLELRQSPEWVELSRSLAGLPRCEPKADPLKAKDDPEVDAAAWRTIRIVITSDVRLQIYRDDKPDAPLTYAEFGLEDKRSKKPNAAWSLLLLFAKRQGVVSRVEGPGRTWPKIEKRVQELRKVLRRHFRLTSDPIPFVPKTGFQTRFKIECHPSFDE